MSTTVDKGEVRPARVEAGQRWAARSLGGREYTLRAHPDVPGQFQRIYSNGDKEGCSWTADEIMRGSDFLGYAPGSRPIRRVPESCLLERWNETGPLSALEAIQAKKPPEPWRPSVDEYDLLPDAGTSWSDTRGSGRP